MELSINPQFEQSIPKVIDFNYEQLKGQLADKLAIYSARVVTEDSIKAGKADRAMLNKLRTTLDDERKRVKKQCLIPFDDFEKKVNELIGMIDKPIAAIDSQVKTFENQRKTEKAAGIKAFFDLNIGDLKELLPFEKISNPKWLNTTYKMVDIQKEITDTIIKVSNDLKIIKAMKLECEQQMLDKYLSTLDMSAAMAEKTRWEEQQKRIKDYEAAQKKTQQDATNQPKTVVINGTPGHDLCDVKPGDNVVFGGSPIMSGNTQAEQLKTISVTFENTTAAFRHAMRDLCIEHGIKYGWTKKEDLQ